MIKRDHLQALSCCRLLQPCVLIEAAETGQELKLSQRA
jgi:hypothetical protein